MTQAPTPAQQDDDEDRKALEAFARDHDDFEELENKLSEFNIFEAIGVVRREIHHSELLAFMLDPNENHGLGDSFLRRFLQAAIAGTERPPVSPVDLNVWDLDDVDVRREWKNIDILILDSRNELAVIVENKVDSGEHSNQLARYWDIVNREVPGFKILPLFLTPHHDHPSDSRYIAIDYALVAEVVERFVIVRSSTIGPDVQTVLQHYAKMLRRHIVSDPAIAELCQKLYRKHRRALDLIFANLPDAKGGVARELFERVVAERADLVKDDSNKTFLRFSPTQWERPMLKGATGWTKSGRALLFEFFFLADRIGLKLTLGPGAPSVRDAVFAAAQSRPDVFEKNMKTLSAKFHQLFQRTMIDSATLEEGNREAIEAMAAAQWAAFTSTDLPKILAVLDSVSAPSV